MLETLKVFAEEVQCDGGVNTALFGCYRDGIWGILELAIDVLTIGIGAAAVLGIVISGIQYMTASGDPAQMTKAKRRLIEIVIGILAYGVFYSVLKWLIPNF